MKKILMILILVIFLVGCQDDSGSSSSQTTPFIGGTTGILISFAQGAPPEEVYDGGDFPFGIDVILKNEGEYTIPAQRAHVDISGILTSDFANVDLSRDIDEELIKTSKDPDGNVLPGTTFHTEYDDLEYTASLEGNQQFTIRSDVCYEYGTTATALICVKENILDVTKKGVCEVTEAKTVYNSGAPVQITSFDEQATGSNTITFTFKIEKKGNGDIYKSKYVGGGDIPPAQCTDERKYRDKIWVDVDAGNAALNNALTCQGLKDSGSAQSNRQGFVTLYSGERPIRCNIDIGSAGVAGNYEKVVTVKLQYDYEEFISTNLLIKHAENE